MLLPVEARQAILSLLPRGGIGAEIGVHRAEFSRQILKRTRPKKLYLIDPWKHFEASEYEQSKYGGLGVDGQKEMDARYQSVRTKMQSYVEKGTVEVIREFSGEAARKFRNDYLDFVYIDGDHSYEGVREDLDKYYPLIKADGLLMLDDYCVGNWWKDGVLKATHELLARTNSKVVFQMDNQIAIQKLA